MSTAPNIVPTTTDVPKPQTRGKVLIVDDERPVLFAFARMLGAKGFDVSTADNAPAALTLIRGNPFETIVTDIAMPGMDGLQLLRAIREVDLDVQVIMHTAAPSVQTAAKAMEHGAYRYLTKPVDIGEFLKAVETAVAVCRVGRDKRVVLDQVGNPSKFVADRVGLEVSFDRALAQLWMAFQPIVKWSTKEIYSHEALVRSREPTMPHPGILFDAAEQLGRLRDLGRKARELSVIPYANGDVPSLLFVNLHAQELSDELLYRDDTPLHAIASQVVLEITERSSLHVIEDARRSVAALRKLGFRIALDDLGAGYAGLASFAALEPDVVKLDMSLVRGVHEDATKRQLIRSVMSLTNSLNRLVVAEGVETIAERDTLIDLGCDLFQGYLFAKPGPAFPAINWGEPKS